MKTKRKDAKPIPPELDAPPEITEEWIASADLHRDEKPVRCGRPNQEHPNRGELP
jgi:hypothetical protein